MEATANLDQDGRNALDFDQWSGVPLKRLTVELAVMDAKHEWPSEGAKAVFNARVTRGRLDQSLFRRHWRLKK